MKIFKTQFVIQGLSAAGQANVVASSTIDCRLTPGQVMSSDTWITAHEATLIENVAQTTAQSTGTVYSLIVYYDHDDNASLMDALDLGGGTARGYRDVISFEYVQGGSLTGSLVAYRYPSVYQLNNQNSYGSLDLFFAEIRMYFYENSVYKSERNDWFYFSECDIPLTLAFDDLAKATDEPLAWVGLQIFKTQLVIQGSDGEIDRDTGVANILGSSTVDCRLTLEQLMSSGAWTHAIDNTLSANVNANIFVFITVYYDYDDYASINALQDDSNRGSRDHIAFRYRPQATVKIPYATLDVYRPGVNTNPVNTLESRPQASFDSLDSFFPIIQPYLYSDGWLL